MCKENHYNTIIIVFYSITIHICCISVSSFICTSSRACCILSFPLSSRCSVGVKRHLVAIERSRRAWQTPTCESDSWALLTFVFQHKNRKGMRYWGTLFNVTRTNGRGSKQPSSGGHHNIYHRLSAASFNEEMFYKRTPILNINAAQN